MGAPSLPREGGQGSLFAPVFSGSTGMRPYAAADSDVYQDMFGEGSYAGRGIYDSMRLRAYYDRAPNSTLLSHDLFEGIFAPRGFTRTSKSSTISHRDTTWRPTSSPLGAVRLAALAVDSRSRRQRRRTPDGEDELPRIGRWKMIDNLRRTVSAPACVLALAVGWALSFKSPLVWTTFLITTIALPSLVPVAFGYSRPPSGCCDVRTFASAGGRAPPRCDSISAELYVSRGPGLFDGRRHRADAVAALRGYR